MSTYEDKLGPDPSDRYVGQRMRIRRRELGLSQAILADELGITFQQVQKYERGANRVSASKLFQAAVCLGVSVAYFFEGLPGAQSTAEEASLAQQWGEFFSTTGSMELATAFLVMSPRLRRGLVDLAREMVLPENHKSAAS